MRTQGNQDTPTLPSLRPPVGGRFSTGARPRTTAEVIAARVADWAATSGFDAAPLLAKIRKVIEQALSEYFRFLTCNGNLMVLSHASPGENAMFLILEPGDRYWRIAYREAAELTEIRDDIVGRLLDNAQKLLAGEAAAPCPGWTLAQDDFPLNGVVCTKLSVPFSVKVTEYLSLMCPLPGRPKGRQTSAIQELANACDDLPDVRARLAIERVAARCDPVLCELVKEDPGVRVREYNFAVSAQVPLPALTVSAGRGVFPPCGGCGMSRICAG